MKEYCHPSLDEVTLPAVMQALSDPCRIAIVRTLLDGGEVACNGVPLEISKATRSHHFAILRDAGLVATRVEGTRCMSSVRKEEFDARFPGLLDLVLKHEKPCGGAAAKAGDLVEN